MHTDHLERPVMMTDDADAIVWQASYLPYGEVSSISGSASLDYRFPGQWFQLESGLHYNWHRHYDATTGRYLQPDPLGMPDGPSRWAYAKNSPLMNVDPTGRFTPTWFWWWLFPPKPQPPYCEYDPNQPITNDGGLGLGGPPALNEQSDPGDDNASPRAPAQPPSSPDTAGTPPDGPNDPDFGSYKSKQKWQDQLQKRGWTMEQIKEAIANGERYPAPNNVNQGNTATRYVNPSTGQSVVVDDQTGEILHVGGPGFKY